MYEEFFGLSCRPFQLNPDPAFFFASSGHQRAMAYLEYGLHVAEGFIVITGEVGAGKTMLARRLLAQLDPGRVVAARLVSTQFDAEDTLRMVCSAFGLEAEQGSKSSLFLRLEHFLGSLVPQQRRALLVVDEVQSLSPAAVEELRLLSNIQADDRSLLQIFLLGQPEFRLTLAADNMVQLRQRVIAAYHLAAMVESDTREYIQHRLRTAGWNGDPEISDEAFQLIHQHSTGVPRRINTLVERALLMCYLAEAHCIDAATIRTVVEDLALATPVPAQPVASPAHAQLAPLRAAARRSLALETEFDWEVRIAGLEARMSKLGRSLSRLLKLMRETAVRDARTGIADASLGDGAEREASFEERPVRPIRPAGQR